MITRAEGKFFLSSLNILKISYERRLQSVNRTWNSNPTKDDVRHVYLHNLLAKIPPTKDEFSEICVDLKQEKESNQFSFLTNLT